MPEARAEGAAIDFPRVTVEMAEHVNAIGRHLAALAEATEVPCENCDGYDEEGSGRPPWVVCGHCWNRLAVENRALRALLAEVLAHDEHGNGPWTSGMRRRIADVLSGPSTLRTNFDTESVPVGPVVDG